MHGGAAVREFDAFRSGFFHPTMSATLASVSWSAASALGPWRFGRAMAHPPGGVQWVLQRNCSLTPRELGAFYLSLCAVSLLIAVGFAVNGAPVVLAFAGIELLVVAVALLVYARHATDGDTLTLQQRELRIEQSAGARLRSTSFRAEWVSVEPCRGGGSLIEVCGEGRSVRVGRFLRPELREPFARELRTALRSARDGAATA